LIELLQNSGLDRTLLSEFWKASAPTSSASLTKLEFFKYLRLIAMHQNNIERNKMDQYLMDRDFIYLPQFKGVPLPSNPSMNMLPKGQIPKPNIVYPTISQTELLEYENVILNVK
jgi:hypothetical protein